MDLDTEQRRAVDAILASHPTANPGRIGGYAGTGKTACIGAALLAADRERDKYLVITPTHRARIMLERTGIAAQTIHSAIYDPVEPRSVDAIVSEQARVEHLCEHAKRVNRDPDREHVIARFERQLVDLEAELRTDVQFKGKGDPAVCGKHVIVDEASMVGGAMLADIGQAGAASIVLVGDPAQLPPILREGERDVFRDAAMDVELRHVYRHRGWILHAAAHVREGLINSALDIARQHGRVFEWGDRFRLQVRTERAVRDYIELCWLRRTRRERNAEIAASARWVDDSGRPHPWRWAGRERVCCEAPAPKWWRRQGRYRESWAPGGVDLAGQPPLNGTFGWRDQVGIMTDDGRVIPPNTPIVHAADLPEKPNRKDIDGRWLWAGGWCVTVHKGQGGQWAKVSVIDEVSDRDPEFRQRWLYTALTRARSDLVWWQA